MHFPFSINSNNLSSTCFQYSNYSSSGGSFTVYATLGIYRASALTSGTLIVLAASQRIVTASWWWIVTVFETCRGYIIEIK
jgi:hypothetical protein